MREKFVWLVTGEKYDAEKQDYVPKEEEVEAERLVVNDDGSLVFLEEHWSHMVVCQAFGPGSWHRVELLD